MVILQFLKITITVCPLASRHRGYYLGASDYHKFIDSVPRDLPNLIEIQHERNFTGENLSSGILDALECFPGFEVWELIEQSNTPSMDYASYEKFYLRDLCEDVEEGELNHSDKLQNLFIPKKIVSFKGYERLVDSVREEIEEDEKDRLP